MNTDDVEVVKHLLSMADSLEQNTQVIASLGSAKDLLKEVSTVYLRQLHDLHESNGLGRVSAQELLQYLLVSCTLQALSDAPEDVQKILDDYELPRKMHDGVVLGLRKFAMSCAEGGCESGVVQ